MVDSSQADHLIDLTAVRRMLDEHRIGTSDHSRRLWTVLIFMLWHAIFVEHTVVPQISEPVYPVQLMTAEQSQKCRDTPVFGYFCVCSR